jgi:hypothetical protein
MAPVRAGAFYCGIEKGRQIDGPVSIMITATNRGNSSEALSMTG